MNIFPTLNTHTTCPAHIILTTEYMATSNLLHIIKLFITPVHPARVVILYMYLFIFPSATTLLVCHLGYIRACIYIYIYIYIVDGK
jgi:hypothetical protein